MYSTQLNKPCVKHLQAAGVLQLFDQRLLLEFRQAPCGRLCLEHTSRISPILTPILLYKLSLSVDSPPLMAESQNSLGWKGF